MGNTHTFCIAGHYLTLNFADAALCGIDLLPSFSPFATKGEKGNCLFSLTVDNSLRPRNKNGKEHIGIFDTGNGDTIVDFFHGDGYQFIIKDICGNCCCLLQTSPDFSTARCALNGSKSMRMFGLNNALMMMYAFAGSAHDTLLIHASLVRNNGYGYAFTAKSGTGKSTHTALWIKHIEGCDLMNDDNPIIRVVNGKAFVYGSPWSGKTPCYRNIKAPLGAIVKIERSDTNSVDSVGPAAAFGIMLASCSSMKWDKQVFGNVCNTIVKIIESQQRTYILHCLPDREAALICHRTISK